MATYIEDEEVSELIRKYAKREGKTKTGALRDLLRRELNVRPKKSPEARFQDALAFVASHPTERTPI
ncbi:MAG: type II toxin-antitoxin system VapB family antitoxin, partial [Acidobacteriaceae bacterium]|nr:type II toxin-antitoxin system VapB family antitoxin [Acidobacteriaceae bacterium]